MRVPVATATTVEGAAELLRSAPSPVVVLAVHNSFGDVVRCLESFAAHTPTDTVLLVVDDCGIDQRAIGLLQDAGPAMGHEVVLLRHAENLGYVRTCNDAFAAAAGRDVVLLNSDVVVGPGWLERLTAAARSSDVVATASTLTNHGTILTVPDRNRPTRSLPGDMTPAEAATRVAAGSLQLRPEIPTAVGHCTYIRRAALDLVGDFDETFSPGYGEEVDFSQRAVMHGFRHICADDVFTFHRGSGSFTPEVAKTTQAQHEAIVRKRYPWYEAWVARTSEDTASNLALALSAARRSLLGMRVGIDARCLGPHRMGTQQVVIETIRALARRPEVDRLVVFGPADLPPYARFLRDVDGVQLVDAEHPWASGHPALDLLYRPFQVNQPDQLELLDQAADRFVVNQLDTIAYENPSYFEHDSLWLGYRDLTRLVLARAGGIAFLSEHSRESATEMGLVSADKPTRVVWCGVDGDDATRDGLAPPGLTSADRGYLLCLGASYLHKNRRLALDLWAELRRRGDDRRIVLAGPTPPHGNSLADEAELLLTRPELRDGVVSLGAISDAEKRWLYRHAGLVLYLSTVEGFGLVPFEAAAYGVPTLSTRQGSLDEVLPERIPVLDAFDAIAAADVAEKLLNDESASEQLCAALREAGAAYTWDRTAAELMTLFEQALRRPRARTIGIEGEAGEHIGLLSRRQRERTTVSGKANDFERAVRFVVQHRGLKQNLSPDGSLRQRAARSVINRARRYLND
jgi:GT2 family glycosyltransferase